MIYDPAEDSFLLAKWVKRYAKGKTVLDIGTGSGILAQTAHDVGATYVLAVDITEEAVNAVRKQGIEVIQSDICHNITESFDLIICNPPYLPHDDEEDEESAVITTGGKEGYEFIERFLKEARSHLHYNGSILLVCSSLSGDVEKLFTHYQYVFTKIDEEKCFFEKLYVYHLTIDNVI